MIGKIVKRFVDDWFDPNDALMLCWYLIFKKLVISDVWFYQRYQALINSCACRKNKKYVTETKNNHATYLKNGLYINTKRRIFNPSHENLFCPLYFSHKNIKDTYSPLCASCIHQQWKSTFWFIYFKHRCLQNKKIFQTEKNSHFDIFFCPMLALKDKEGVYSFYVL